MAFAREGGQKRRVSTADAARFEGRVALVTGASSGIGRACARRFSQLGSKVVLTARNRERLEALAAELEPAAAAVVPADLNVATDIKRLADVALEAFGRVDFIVNNAGVGLYAAVHRSEIEDVRRLFELNFFGPVELVRRLAPQIPSGGAVVNVSSIGGKVPLPWQGIYAASKYALNAYSDILRLELEPAGVQVLCVCPGYVDTPFREHVIAGEIPPDVQAGRGPWRLTADQCADEIIDGLRRRKRNIVRPRLGWGLVALTRLFPRAVFRRMSKMNSGGGLSGLSSKG